jgi:hypothetical protein
MATKAPRPEAAEGSPSLPEKIGSPDLERLNEALTALFGKLRFARSLPPGQTNGRLGAVVALEAAWTFLMTFQPALGEGLHMPLLNLHGALLDLNENNIAPVLRPAKRTGRAVLSSDRNALVGIVIGTARRLEWTALTPAAADKAVATKLAALGVKPARGKNDITAATLRGWRKRLKEVQPLLRVLPSLLCLEISPADRGWINAAMNAEEMLTEKWRSRVEALATAAARRFILDALENGVRQMKL